MISTLTVKPLLWLSGGLFAALVVTAGGGVIYHQHSTATLRTDLAEANGTINSLTTQRNAADAKVKELAQAGSKSHEAIESLAGKLDAAIKETENLDAALRNAETQLASSRRDRQNALEQLTAQRENDYATDASCAAWGAAPVCGRITGSVQEQWRAAQRRR